MRKCLNCGREVDPNQRYCCAKCYCEHTGGDICGVKLGKKGEYI